MPEARTMIEERIAETATEPPAFDLPTIFRMIGLFFLPAREVCQWTRVGIEAALQAIHQGPDDRPHAE